MLVLAPGFVETPGVDAGPGQALMPWTAMLGIDNPVQRSGLLRLGYGEALGWGVGLDELAQRIERMAERALAVPRLRRVGALRLDLIAREAFVAGRGLGLHPREFDLLWRLAEHPGRAVSVAALLGEVWRLSFRPETNSLAVHVSRLRKKLRIAGLDGLIETTESGAYRLAIAMQLPAPTVNFELDATMRLGKERQADSALAAVQEHDHAT